LGPSAPTPAGYLTVAEAAERLGVKPWDVMRMVQTGDLQSLVLIESASVEAPKEKS
jgi:excisionase family DNA binding protein